MGTRGARAPAVSLLEQLEATASGTERTLMRHLEVTASALLEIVDEHVDVIPRLRRVAW